MSDERYLRHNMIDWFRQDDLKRSRFGVIGAGAVGNEVIKNLALLGVGEIDVFDFDTIEEHNLTRSVLFREKDVGSHKAQVAAMRAATLDPNVSARGFVGDFWDLISIEAAKSYTAIFCCVDSFEARIRCNTLAFLAETDLIVIGLDSRFGSIEVFPFSQSLELGCYECSLPDTVYQRIAKRYSCGWLKKAAFVQGRVPTTIITSSAASSLAVSMGLRLGGLQNEIGVKVLIDTIEGTTSKSLLTRRDDCPCCARLPHHPIVITCSPKICALPPTLHPNVTFTTSEPLLVGYKIGGESHIVWECAGRFDDTFPASVSRTPELVEMEIRDQFTLSEICSRFLGRVVPCKFLVFGSEPPIIFEMGE
jgi:molybdopterin/thiamine biosynthesis adenylyltransferase